MGRSMLRPDQERVQGEPRRYWLRPASEGGSCNGGGKSRLDVGEGSDDGVGKLAGGGGTAEIASEVLAVAIDAP